MSYQQRQSRLAALEALPLIEYQRHVKEAAELRQVLLQYPSFNVVSVD